MFYEPDGDDDHELDSTEASAQFETLRTRFSELEDDLRLIGLYNPQTIPVPAPGRGLALMVTMDVGEVAFTDRVQRPEDHKVNNEFANIEADLQRDTFLDERARIKRNLDAGRGAYDDGHEDE